MTCWRHQMETFSALLPICAGNSPVTCEFPAQRSVTRNFDVFLDLRLNERLSKQSLVWWFETPPRPLWSHCNDFEHKTYTANSFYMICCHRERSHVWMCYAKVLIRAATNIVLQYNRKYPSVRRLGSTTTRCLIDVKATVFDRWD